MKMKSTIGIAGWVLAGLLNSLGQPPVITTQPQPLEAAVGGTATLFVEATGAEPLSYQWYLNNPGNPLPGATNATLVISNVQVSDDGWYRVTVSNAEGSVWSSSAHLSVLLPPTITAQPTSQIGLVGGTTTFSVTVSGATPLFYQWLFNGNDLAGETNSTLVLSNLQPPQAGSYSVMVANVSGSVTSQVATLSLFVTVNPPFDPGLSVAWELDQLRISWQGEGLLEQAESLSGPWSSLASTNSAALVSPDNSGLFFQVRNPHPRSVQVFIPSAYEAGMPLPLIILLHGRGGTGSGIEGRFNILPLAESRGFLYCYPDAAIVDEVDRRSWNATDACCNFFGATVDDAAFLLSLVLEVHRTLGADLKRVHLVGHSNGGFMAYRMACQHSHVIAGIASLAGMTFINPTDCQPSEPVHILHIHGTADPTVPYHGGALVVLGLPPDNPHVPSAMECIQYWAGYNGCTDLVTDPEPSLDLDLEVPGLDTLVTRYNTCPPGGSVELWTIQYGDHSPGLSPEFSPSVVDWLLAHPKP